MGSDDVELRMIPAVRVAYMRHVGPYGSRGISEMWQRLEAWCVAQGLTSPRRRMFGIAQDNPNITPEGRTRYDACVEVDDDFEVTGEDDVEVQTIRGGQYACSDFFGSAAEIKAAWVRLLGKTMPQAGYQHDVAPAMEIYEPGFAVDPRTGAFACTLCMAVRS